MAEKPFHRVQKFSPPVSVWSARMIASRASKKPGRQGCSFIAFSTSLWEETVSRRRREEEEDALEDERVAVLRHEGLLARAGAVEVALRDGAIRTGGGRVKVVGEAVLLNEALGNDPEDLRPYFTDGVDTEVSRLVEGLVSRRVDGLVLCMGLMEIGSPRRRAYKRVGVVADALDAVRGP